MSDSMSDRVNPVSISGKRIMALDVGTVRIGVAVCDELHITVSTRPVIVNDANVMVALQQRLAADRIDVLLVGVPRKVDDTTSPIIETIERFIADVRQHVSIPVVEVDEAFSTQQALAVMRSTSMSKKRRHTKGTKDQVAAAVILREFLDERH